MQVFPASRSSPRATAALLVAAAALAAAPAAATTPGEPVPFRWIHQVRWAPGDDPARAAPAFDDAEWRQAAFEDVPHPEGIVWLRGRLELAEGHLPEGRPYGLLLAALATCDLYWDGEELVTGGRVGATRRAEEPGPVEQVVHVPDHLAGAGEHLVALRCSAHHRGFVPATGFWMLVGGPYDLLVSAGASYAWPAMISLSGMVLVGLLFLALWVTDRRDRSHLMLAALCLAAAALLVAESWRNLFGYTYDLHLLRLRVVTALAWLVNALLVLFLITRFPRRGGRWMAGAAAVAAALPPFLFHAWDPRSLVMFVIVLPLALAWVIPALFRREPGSLAAVLGLAVCLGVLVAAPRSFIEQGLYPALSVLLLGLLVSHARGVRRQRRERRRALERSARLEAELLKRQLSPHFLMNSLTALTDWLEEDPATASRMVHALAAELRLLGDLAARRRVPVGDELELCRLHLEVMGLRRDTVYRLETEGVDPARELPPAVLHTLVENAVTHHRGAAGGEVTLRLRREPLGEWDRYVFTAPSGEGDGEAAEVEEAERGREGTGLRYVRSRLEEAYGDRFSLSSGRRGDDWRSVIEVPA